MDPKEFCSVVLHQKKYILVEVMKKTFMNFLDLLEKSTLFTFSFDKNVLNLKLKESKDFGSIMYLYTNPIFKYDVNNDISLSGLETKHRDLSKKAKEIDKQKYFLIKNSFEKNLSNENFDHKKIFEIVNLCFFIKDFRNFEEHDDSVSLSQALHLAATINRLLTITPEHILAELDDSDEYQEYVEDSLVNLSKTYSNGNDSDEPEEEAVVIESPNRLHPTEKIDPESLKEMLKEAIKEIQDDGLIENNRDSQIYDDGPPEEDLEFMDYLSENPSFGTQEEDAPPDDVLTPLENIPINTSDPIIKKMSADLGNPQDKIKTRDMELDGDFWLEDEEPEVRKSTIDDENLEVKRRSMEYSGSWETEELLSESIVLKLRKTRKQTKEELIVLRNKIYTLITNHTKYFDHWDNILNTKIIKNILDEKIFEKEDFLSSNIKPGYNWRTLRAKDKEFIERDEESKELMDVQVEAFWPEIQEILEGYFFKFEYIFNLKNKPWAKSIEKYALMEVENPIPERLEVFEYLKKYYEDLSLDKSPFFYFSNSFVKALIKAIRFHKDKQVTWKEFSDGFAIRVLSMPNQSEQDDFEIDQEEYEIDEYQQEELDAEEEYYDSLENRNYDSFIDE